MGTDLSKHGEGESPGSPAETSTVSTSLIAAEWGSWLQHAEVLFVRGQFKAYQEALQKDVPSLPSEPMVAALLKAVTKANASIGKRAEFSLRAQVRGGRGEGRGLGPWGEGVGDGGRTGMEAGTRAVSAGIDGNTEVHDEQASLADLESALQETVAVAVRAATPTASSGSRAGGPGGGDREGLGYAVLAAAAEDVAVQIACAVMTWRLARGEPAKALSVGLRLLESRRATVTGAAAASGLDDIGTAMGSVNGASAAGFGSEQNPGALNGGQGPDRRRRRRQREEDREGDEEQEEEEVKQDEEEEARDAFYGARALCEAFESALGDSGGSCGGGGRRLPLQEAAPRLLHLLRLSWLLAVANLALGRAAAATRLVIVGEYAQGARASAWRKASHLLATRPPGGASAAYSPRPRGTTSAALHSGGGGRDGRAGAATGGAGSLRRDPALAMCKFLRGMALLAQGDLQSAAGRLEESLELDPRFRHALVSLAHISCFASSAAAVADPCTRSPKSSSAAAAVAQQPSPERTKELLGLLELGASAHFGFVEHDRLLLRLRGAAPAAGGPAAGGEQDADGGGDGDGGNVGGRRGGGESGGFVGSWRAFHEEGGGGVEAWILLGCVARAGGDHGGAVSRFRRALALDPHCLEAVYGIARVLQESGDHLASRELLLFLGERSQELLRDGSSTGDFAATNVNNTKSRGGHPFYGHRLRFPLDTEGRTPGVPEGLGWQGTAADAAATTGAVFLPAAPVEVMWRVARASMGARDWATAVLALKGLASELAPAPAPASPEKLTAAQLYFASFWNAGGDRNAASFSSSALFRAPPAAAAAGPRRERVLRALAFCQIKRGLYRDALETASAALGAGGASAASGGEGDAAMLMLRADALLCLEEEEAVVEASLDRAAELLSLCPIDMSLPPPAPSSSTSAPIRTTAAATVVDEGAAAAATAASVEQLVGNSFSRQAPSRTPPLPPPRPPGKRNRMAEREERRTSSLANATSTPGQEVGGGGSRGSFHAPHMALQGAHDAVDAGDTTGSPSGSGSGADRIVTPRDRAVDRDQRLARSAALNNRAILLVAAGRGEEACRLLRACLLLLPEEPRPVFNLTLALWKLGRRRAACAHWLGARSWLGESGGGGGGGGENNSKAFAKLLDWARRRKALLKSETAESAKRRSGGGGGGRGAFSSSAATVSHVTDGQGDPLSLPPMQICLLDIRCLTWWLDNNLGMDSQPPAAAFGPRGSGLRQRLRETLQAPT